MRQIVAILGAAVVLAGLTASSATADSTDVKLRVEGRVELVSPTLVLLTTSYDCPVGAEAAITASVSQLETGAFGSSFVPVPVDCTGRWETLALNIVALGFPATSFELGGAAASARISIGGPQFDEEERSVRIIA